MPLKAVKRDSKYGLDKLKLSMDIFASLIDCTGSNWIQTGRSTEAQATGDLELDGEVVMKLTLCSYYISSFFSSKLLVALYIDIFYLAKLQGISYRKVVKLKKRLKKLYNDDGTFTCDNNSVYTHIFLFQRRISNKTTSSSHMIG